MNPWLAFALGVVTAYVALVAVFVGFLWLTPFGRFPGDDRLGHLRQHPPQGFK